MTEQKFEKIEENAGKVLEQEVKMWLAQPVTQAYFSTLQSLINVSREKLIEYLDQNDLPEHRMKLDVEINKSDRTTMEKVINPDVIMNRLRANNMIVEEE
jgi:hypothetical protein